MPQVPPIPASASQRTQKNHGLGIVAIGASAGGLSACSQLLDALPARPGLAFVIVQHLAPDHDSRIAELLQRHTVMPVVEAENGAFIAADHVYVIPPGYYLSVANNMLKLTRPQPRQGARLPFDFLLASLSSAGPRVAALILSGTGGDGSLGLPALHAAGGLVIAQAAAEAEYGGMPAAAIATGSVDAVVSIAYMPALLARWDKVTGFPRPVKPETAESQLAAILALASAASGQDFAMYKTGTLERRTARRIAMAGLPRDAYDLYLAMLEAEPGEAAALADDILINVTGFFRDPSVFDLLEASTIPEMLAGKADGDTLRVWIAGCSTGEETYSLAILLREALVRDRREIKLQIFASDVDADAIARARDGLYSTDIHAAVSVERLARFFTAEDNGYRVRPELRNAVIFTRQDLLGDPPFSRLDFISCRNLLIYLQPEAQARVISMFHFALRNGSILLLGSAETVADMQGRFVMLNKAARLYRHIGDGHAPQLVARPADASGPVGALAKPPSKPTILADLCRQKLLDAYAPAAVLCDVRLDCVYHLGPTDQFLAIAAGRPVNNVLMLARASVRPKLRLAIERALHEGRPVSVGGGRLNYDARTIRFRINVEPVTVDNEAMLFIAFVETAPVKVVADTIDIPRIDELEAESRALHSELQHALHQLDEARVASQATHDEALSVTEEYQATTEEMLASQEELQSLNEELTALNGQLQETLERQRTTSDDLENVLFSTDVATLFLDRQLNIRFFTPATQRLFNIISGDVGRPLADLAALAADRALPDDAALVLGNAAPVEREIGGERGIWYSRRITPYRAQDSRVEGVVVTFVDVTERRRISEALAAAERAAQSANLAKSRFLAAASHDLRQPLQTLTLLHGLLTQAVPAVKGAQLVDRLGETLDSMTTMLNAVLDINRIEAGNIAPDKQAFPAQQVLDRLHDEFIVQARAKALGWRVMPSTIRIRTDPELLHQMLLNLLSNAFKYTRTGRVLLGCRRTADHLRFEIWDTGRGIPEHELDTIFEEYHQLDNPARERALGLGLGLSIVKHLGLLLDHPVAVRSSVDRGSVFSIAVSVDRSDIPLSVPQPQAADIVAPPPPRSSGLVLIVDDDIEILALLEQVLIADGYRTISAVNATDALALLAHPAPCPDLILADYNLPGDQNGLALVAQLRRLQGRAIPAVIVTGDIATQTLRATALAGCVQLSKPVKVPALLAVVRKLVAAAVLPAVLPDSVTAGYVHVIEDDVAMRSVFLQTLAATGLGAIGHESSEAFLAEWQPAPGSCLLIDAYLPGMPGIELLQLLRTRGDETPALIITGKSDVAMAVAAMKAGAFDFIEKPVPPAELISHVAEAMGKGHDKAVAATRRTEAATRLASLSGRQREVMAMVLAGHPSKIIAADLGISQRTVESHRAAVMLKMGCRSLPALARLAMLA